jgi:hypothetical protein
MEITLADLQRTYAGKADDELLQLHARGTLTDTAYEALEAELVKRNLAVPPRPAQPVEAAAPGYETRVTLAAHWRGQASLASAFWLLAVVGSALLSAMTWLVSRAAPTLLPIAALAVFAFMVFAWVSVWRCWKNTRWPAWGYIARGWVLLQAFPFAVGLVILLVQFGVRIVAGLSSGPGEGSLLE